MARKDKEQKVSGPQGPLPPARLRKVYREQVVPKLMEQFKYSTVMQVPRLVKVTVNMGTGSEEKELDNSLRDMQVITGQKPVPTIARKSISNFKLREGMKIGCRVTLRGDRMYYFFDKLCTVALPRIRDFQGLSPKSFDGRGNYSLGLKEQLVFPEIDYDSFDKIRGMDITVVTTARTDEEGRALLKMLGMPLREK
ncbi:MAG: 50S ribosomal protein L5 [Fimbriimonadaceae bacterium]|nr:50S ribosomal protein L5 [Fimbriimonadaceae bacterium]QYK55030.1 MAG: 50S ribosomal protein L5 [Fimbriimonadaceae bacterium]